MIEFGEPILDPKADETLLEYKAMESDWKDRLKISDEKWKKDAAARSHFKAFFLASETYLGPLTAACIAGYFKRNLKIRTKDPRKPLIPFVVTAVQYSFLEEVCRGLDSMLPVRMILLKARQFGFSTAIQALFYMLLQRLTNISGTTVAHRSDATGNLHEMWKTFWRNAPYRPSLLKSNRQLVQFAAPTSCQMNLDTAENKDVKRSFTNQLIHASEIAFWPYANETRLSLMQTVGDLPGTIVIEESTANGMGGTFHKQWWAARKRENDFKPLFYPWHKNPEYSMELSKAKANDVMLDLSKDEKDGVDQFGWTAGQVAWRRKCIGDKCAGDLQKFHQEYPSTDREAFLVSGSHVFDQVLLERRRELCARERLQWRGSIVYAPSDL